jgi:hypothetical protein
MYESLWAAVLNILRILHYTHLVRVAALHLYPGREFWAALER